MTLVRNLISIINIDVKKTRWFLFFIKNIIETRVRWFLFFIFLNFIKIIIIIFKKIIYLYNYI